VHVLCTRLWEKRRRKKKVKREIDKEYSKWPIVEYAFQDVKFFEEISKKFSRESWNRYIGRFMEHQIS
jgi:hypothetical protein